jgi:hypothetical protein
MHDREDAVALATRRRGASSKVFETGANPRPPLGFQEPFFALREPRRHGNVSTFRKLPKNLEVRCNLFHLR